MSVRRSPFAWQRSTIGGLAVLLLLMGLITLLVLPASASSQSFAGVCIRVGLLLGALWLALPEVLALATKYPRWWWIALGLAAALVFLQPGSLMYLIPIGIGLWFLYRTGLIKQLIASFSRHRPPKGSRESSQS